LGQGRHEVILAPQVLSTLASGKSLADEALEILEMVLPILVDPNNLKSMKHEKNIVQLRIDEVKEKKKQKQEERAIAHVQKILLMSRRQLPVGESSSMQFLGIFFDFIGVFPFFYLLLLSDE
jgi:hypothetical protein